MFSVFGVFTVLGFAVAAGEGLDVKLAILPRFLRFRVFLFAVWTFHHVDRLSICLLAWIYKRSTLLALGV